MEPFPHRAFLKRPASAGFTLIEMLVVLAIIVIVTAIALSNQSGFNRTLALNNAAYDIALSIEQAQSFGLSSLGLNNAGYGIAFATSPNTSYTFFIDSNPAAGSASACHCNNATCAALPDAKPGNCEYDGGSERITTYDLNNGFTLDTMCVYPTTGAHVCSTGSLTNMAISFVRPNTETFIAGKTGVTWNTTYIGACLTLKSPQGDKRYISISQTGQVALTTTVCQ